MMTSGLRASIRTSARLAFPLALALGLAACESGARQDPNFVRGNTTAGIMPSIAHPVPTLPGTDAMFGPNGAPDSPIAYQRPAAPTYADRPLSQNLQSSLEVADYVHGLSATGLLDVLRRDGPFTVFAIPNGPLERFAGQTQSFDLKSTQNQPVLKRILGYTIVRGSWDQARLRRAIARSGGKSFALTTLSGDHLFVLPDPASGQLVLANARGEQNRLWFVDAKQSNGMLFFTQGLLLPG